MNIKNQNLAFEVNDDPDVISFTHMNNSEAWKGILTREEYVDREGLLGGTEIAQRYKDPATQKEFPIGYEWLGIKYFVLKDTRLPNTDKTSQIVSSCETLNRLAYCTSPDSYGKIELCLNVCIGGVFTEAKYRGKGYAKVMIESLNKFYDNIRGEPDAPAIIKNLVITLYSEVGDYYSQMGYHTFHVPLHNISKIDEFYQEYCHGSDKVVGKFLEFDDYEHLIDLQDEEFRKDLMKSQHVNKNSFIFMVKPDLDIFKWFQYRDIFIQEKTNNGTEQPPFGFELEDQNHIIWHHNWNDNTLIITKIYIAENTINKETILEKLFTKAINEVKRTDLNKLQFWDFEVPPTEYPVLQSALNKICNEQELYAQNSSVSAVRPPPGYNKDTIIWEKNSKYCWF